MGRLDGEARMTIKALSARGAARSEIARLLGVTEGAVRYQVRRIAWGMIDGRSRQKLVAEAFAAAIAHWRSQQGESGVNLAALHEWLRCEHGYVGSLRSVQRYWKRNVTVGGARSRTGCFTERGAARSARRKAQPTLKRRASR